MFVRLEEPTTTSEEPNTTSQATDLVETDAQTSSTPGTTTTTKSIQKQSSEPTVNTQVLPSDSTQSNGNDTTPLESSAAGGLQLGLLVATVVVMQ